METLDGHQYRLLCGSVRIVGGKAFSKDFMRTYSYGVVAKFGYENALKTGLSAAEGEQPSVGSILLGVARDAAPFIGTYFKGKKALQCWHGK
jgi:hypothetical protein